MITLDIAEVYTETQQASHETILEIEVHDWLDGEKKNHFGPRYETISCINGSFRSRPVLAGELGRLQYVPPLHFVHTLPADLLTAIFSHHSS